MLTDQSASRCQHCGQVEELHRSYIPYWIKKRVIFDPALDNAPQLTQAFEGCFCKGRLVLDNVALLALRPSLDNQGPLQGTSALDQGNNDLNKGGSLTAASGSDNTPCITAHDTEAPLDLRDPLLLNDPNIDLARLKDICRASLAHLLKEVQGRSTDPSASISLFDLYVDEMAMLPPTMINGIQVWLKFHESGLYHQAFLLGTSMLDRLVGNIIFTAQGPDAVIPFIMRELLATPCLVTILGLDMLRILWTLVGSPLTLNLRNLSWHGFILPCDGVPMDAYSAMLIIVFMTILEILRKQSFSLILRPSSEYYQPSENAKRTKDDFSIRYDHLWRPSENKLSEVLNTEGIGMYIRDLCQYSELVTPGSLKQWREACEHILQFRWPPDNNQSVSSDQGHCNDASLLFVMATLPLVEHGLRRIYVRLNKCKPDREHALVGGEYYVTLDVILDALVPEEFFNKQHPASEMKCGKNGVRGQPNRLLEALGPERVNICFDLFVCPRGPRLRDRVSHGEANMLIGEDITGRDWFHVYSGLVLSLLAHFPIKDTMPTNTLQSLQDIGLSCTIDNWVGQYTVLEYDNLALLKKDLLRSLWTLCHNSSSITALNPSEYESEHDVIVQPLFQVRKDGLDTPITLMFNKCNTGGDIDQIMDEAVALWRLLRPENIFTQSISGWNTLVQLIQQALEKTSSKFMALREEHASGKISTRKWRQLTAMKETLPRLWGMLAACLCFVEYFVLFQPDDEEPDQQLARGNHPTLIIPLNRGRGSKGNGESEQPLEPQEWISRVSKQEIQLRIKIMAFVDRYLASMERFSLEAIEQAWGGLRGHLRKILVDQYLEE